MPLFLVTSLFDEGMYESDFQVVEAESELVIAQHMLDHPAQWENYLSRAYPRNWRDLSYSVGTLWDCVQNPEMTAERFLELIEMTSVDGDSGSQLRIFEVTVKQLSEVDTNPWKGKTVPIVRL
jgi:hypothetical protein